MFVNRKAIAGLLPAPKPARMGRSSGSHHWNMRRGAVGMELRGTSLYLACVRPGWNRRWITATAVIDDYAALDAATLGSRMRDAVDNAAGEDPIVVLGMPRRDVIVRHLKLPAAAAGSLDSVLNLQLGLYKPSDDEDFCSDAAVVAGEAQLAVSLMFVPQARVQELGQRFADAGFPVSRLTTAQFATLDWSLRNMTAQEKPPFVLLHAVRHDAEIAVVENGCCTMTRGFALPENATLAHIAAEVQRTLATRRTASGERVKLIVSGELASEARSALAEIGEVIDLSEHCGFGSLVTDSTGSNLESFGGAMALALNGLAWSGDYRLNLLPKEQRAARRRWRNAPTYALLVANVLLLTALAARGPIQRVMMLRRYNAEIERVERDAGHVERELRKQEQVEDRLAALRDFQEHGRKPLDALSEVAQKLPTDAWVGNYTCRQGQVDISGIAKSGSAVLPALKASTQFDDVRFAGGLTRDTDGTERFHIMAKLRGEPVRDEQ